MNANQKPVAAAMKITPLALVKFSKSKTTIAAEMTEKQYTIFETGEHLGHAAAGDFYAWSDALKMCKTPADRKVLRAGFVSSYTVARKVTAKQAANKFDYLAREHAPAHTSRQRKANAAKAETRGRKEKEATGTGAVLSEKQVAARLTAALAYIAKAQQSHAGDSEMLETLGEIAAILGGKV